jgi:hypothetical protein
MSWLSRKSAPRSTSDLDSGWMLKRGRVSARSRGSYSRFWAVSCWLRLRCCVLDGTAGNLFCILLHLFLVGLWRAIISKMITTTILNPIALGIWEKEVSPRKEISIWNDINKKAQRSQKVEYTLTTKKPLTAVIGWHEYALLLSSNIYHIWLFTLSFIIRPIKIIRVMKKSNIM